ncbi:MAG: hypothetical protein ACYSSI_08720 [Planctomycetota bacterium]|jgi:hypothetical protein
MESSKLKGKSLRKKTLLIISVCFFVFICLGVFVYLHLPTLGTTYTLSDFESEEDVWEFVNDHLPITLPKNAVITELKCERWQDWTLKATVVLSAEEAENFRSELESLKVPAELTPKGENEVRYFLEKCSGYGTVTFFPGTGKLVIDFFTM